MERTPTYGDEFVFIRISCGRLPRGRRGLKPKWDIVKPPHIKSPPAWEAWIETEQIQLTTQQSIVASRVGGVD